MSTSFTFRQRIGKLDWKAVSSVSTEDIVQNLKISELQSVLDEVTFCEFSAIDVKTNTVESITKLVQLMQLISEYLLHCQEAQFKIMKELNAKGTKLKSNYEKLKLENVSLKEDCKIYQRQLAMLRKTLSKGLPGDEDNEANSKRILAEEWRLAQLAVDRQNSNSMAPEIVESILQHERESRVYMLSLLDEQRKTFASEMTNMMEAIRNTAKSTQSSSSSAPSEAWIEGIKSQLESACEYAIKRATEQAATKKTSVTTSMDVRRSISQQQGGAKDGDSVGLLLREAALDTKEAELNDLERDLVKREQHLKHREIAMSRELEVEREKLRKALREANREGGGGAGGNAVAVQSRMIIRCKSLAAKTILSRFYQVLWRKKLRGFRVWLRQVQELRELETLREHGRLLKTAATKPSRGEEELRNQLEVERSRVLAGQARCAQLSKEVDSLQAQLSRAEENTGESMKRDADFHASLQSEKDRAVVANAKYNALLTRSEKEKKELLDKLQRTEDLLAKEASKIRPSGTPTLVAPARANSSTSTSASPMPSVATSTANLQPSLLLSQFSAQYMVENEDELLLRAQQRVADRKNSQMTLEAKAMAMLAQEINGKLYASQ